MNLGTRVARPGIRRQGELAERFTGGIMAEAEVYQRFAEGGSIRLTLRSEAEHPDALDMLATRVMRMWSEMDQAEAEDVD